VIVLSPLLLLMLPLPPLKTSFFTVLLLIKIAISKAPSGPNSLLLKLSTLNPGVSMIQASSGPRVEQLFLNYDIFLEIILRRHVLNFPSHLLPLAACLVLSNTRRGWANAPRWGERQRRWLAALLPLP
jgi:hypothetical protein